LADRQWGRRWDRQTNFRIFTLPTRLRERHIFPSRWWDGASGGRNNAAAESAKPITHCLDRKHLFFPQLFHHPSRSKP